MPSPEPGVAQDQPAHHVAGRVLSVGLLVAIVAMVGYSLASLVLPGAELMPDHPSVFDFLTFALIFVAFPAVGVVVSWKRPENPIGWIFIAIGFGIVVSVFAAEYAGRAIYVQWEHPAVELAAWIGSWTWFIASGLALTFAVLLFPDGRLPGPRWRPVAWLAAGVIGLTTVAGALDPGLLDDYGGVIRHPIDLGESLGGVASSVAAVGFAAILVLGVVSVTSLIVRLRRARGVERQQIKGLLYPVGLLLVASTAAQITQHEAWWTFTLVALAAIPVGAGIAILRYRLFDIDVVINRTLVYASLSVVLGALYVGMVLLLQTVLSPFTQNNAPAVALSTLAVAALFGPVRRRLQSLVDRRFYRERYDAHRTLERFATGLRSEVDLAALTVALRQAATQALQPAGVSVWLREHRR